LTFDPSDCVIQDSIGDGAGDEFKIAGGIFRLSCGVGGLR
jgi:hypothetical protein